MDSVVSLARSSSSKKTFWSLQTAEKEEASSGLQQLQSQDPQGDGPSTDSWPFHGKSPKTPAKPQGFAGKSRGRGRDCGRT